MEKNGPTKRRRASALKHFARKRKHLYLRDRTSPSEMDWPENKPDSMDLKSSPLSIDEKVFCSQHDVSIMSQPREFHCTEQGVETKICSSDSQPRITTANIAMPISTNDESVKSCQVSWPESTTTMEQEKPSVVPAAGWTCVRCTLWNAASHRRCEVCCTRQPPSIKLASTASSPQVFSTVGSDGAAAYSVEKENASNRYLEGGIVCAEKNSTPPSSEETIRLPESSSDKSMMISVVVSPPVNDPLLKVTFCNKQAGTSETDGIPKSLPQEATDCQNIPDSMLGGLDLERAFKISTTLEGLHNNTDDQATYLTNVEKDMVHFGSMFVALSNKMGSTLELLQDQRETTHQLQEENARFRAIFAQMLDELGSTNNLLRDQQCNMQRLEEKCNRILRHQNPTQIRQSTLLEQNDGSESALSSENDQDRESSPKRTLAERVAIKSHGVPEITPKTSEANKVDKFRLTERKGAYAIDAGSHVSTGVPQEEPMMSPKSSPNVQFRVSEYLTSMDSTTTNTAAPEETYCSPQIDVDLGSQCLSSALSRANSTQTIDPDIKTLSASKALEFSNGQAERKSPIESYRRFQVQATSKPSSVDDQGIIPPNRSLKLSLVPTSPKQLKNSTNAKVSTQPRSGKQGWISNKPSRAFLSEMDNAALQSNDTLTTRPTSNDWISARTAHKSKFSKKSDTLWEESQQTDYPYKETVRCHAVRKGLPCHDCQDCRKFFDTLKDTGHEFSQDPLQFSRHRSRFEPTETPVDFWELDFIDERNADLERLAKEKGLVYKTA
jgi:hypothetical protein